MRLMGEVFYEQAPEFLQNDVRDVVCRLLVCVSVRFWESGGRTAEPRDN